MTTLLSKIKLPKGLVRAVVILLASGVIVFIMTPRAESFVDEARSSKAASKARVVQRGAQILATQRLVAGDSFESAADYIKTADGMKQALELAGYPVDAVEITAASLDKKGLLTDFSCVVEYEERRYSVSFDISGHSGAAVLLDAGTKLIK